MRSKQVILTILSVSLALYVHGCVAVAAGIGAAGTVAYVKGDLEMVESKGIDNVYTATKKAMKQLGFSVTKDEKDWLSAVIVAHDVKDNRVTIKLSSTASKATKLSIRVGLLGNEAKSRLIYQKIRDNLK